MSEVFYVSDGHLYRAANGNSKRIPCGAVDNYRKTVLRIHKKNEWKTQGTGALFMGRDTQRLEERSVKAGVAAVVSAGNEKLIYASTLEADCAIYSKSTKDPEAADEYIARFVDTRIYHIDYCPAEKMIVLSASDGYLEKHIALCNEETANYRLITEGDSVDITPSFSLEDNNIIFFSSAGFYIDRNRGGVKYSSYAICTYDIAHNELCEVLSDDKYDFIHPQQTADGTLYCIRRLKQNSSGRGQSLLDIVLAPFRFLRAVFGWANIFSQRYSGKSLTKGTKGPNPAMNREMNEREIFIEENLINVEKNIKENTLAGEKYPGIAPKSWELISPGDDGSVEIVKRGVMSYAFDSDGRLIYSNGKYIIIDKPDGEEVICEADIAASLCF